MGVIVTFNRDRDSFQTARAFAEVGRLDQFVTDYYEGAWPFRIPGLSHRTAPEIPPEKVTPSIQAFLAQMPYEVSRRLRPTDFPSHFVESALGRTASAVARRSPESDLFLYSGSALEAFRGPSTGRRVLFQYHPSPSFIESTMTTIDELADARPWVPEAEINSPAMEKRHLGEVSLADFVACASDFTKRGLLSVGVPEEKIATIPYGCPVPAQLPPLKPVDECRFLFVGQGVQRKGLHLLLEAWKQARLTGATLRIVASRLDPEIAAMAESLDDVTITGRVSRDELDLLMAECDTFLLPSLVEGFGLVLGEALGHGARLIASTDTGLVDLDLDPAVKTVVEAGRVAPLVDALRQARESYEPARSYRDLAVAGARKNSWESFREGIRQTLPVETSTSQA